MARWRLTQPHYLNVPGVEWEYKENDRQTGRAKRTMFPVPMFLNPDDPADWNYRVGDVGEIIVTNVSAPGNADITFIGDPTPDMTPLDDEARAISASFAAKWKHPIESLPENGGFSQALLNGLQSEVSNLQSKVEAAPAIQGLDKLLEAMSTMMAQNAQIIGALVEAKAEPAKARRA